MVLGHQDSLIVFVHLGQAESIKVELRACVLPPYWEMLSEAAAEIAAVGGGLGNNFMENFVGAIPIGGLYHQKEGDCE